MLAISSTTANENPIMLIEDTMDPAAAPGNNSAEMIFAIPTAHG